MQHRLFVGPQCFNWELLVTSVIYCHNTYANSKYSYYFLIFEFLKYIYQNWMERIIIWLVILPISRISIYFSVLVGCFLFIKDSITFYHISWELMRFLQLVINVKDGQTMKTKNTHHVRIFALSINLQAMFATWYSQHCFRWQVRSDLIWSDLR